MERVKVTEHLLEIIKDSFLITPTKTTTCCLTGCYDVISF